MQTDTVISRLVISTSLSTLSYYNVSQRIQNMLTSSCWHHKALFMFI